MYLRRSFVINVPCISVGRRIGTSTGGAGCRRLAMTVQGEEQTHTHYEGPLQGATYSTDPLDAVDDQPRGNMFA